MLNRVVPSGGDSQLELLPRGGINASSDLQNSTTNDEEAKQAEFVRFRLKKAKGEITRQLLAVWTFQLAFCVFIFYEVL